eukprot:1121734-Rhodomonas_salina.1
MVGHQHTTTRTSKGSQCAKRPICPTGPCARTYPVYVCVSGSQRGKRREEEKAWKPVGPAQA